MKKILILLSALIAMAPVCHSQIQKPSVMVVPDSTWCIDNGFAITSPTGVAPDFNKFIAKTPEWDIVVSELNEMINNRGLDTVDLNRVLVSHGQDSIYSASQANLILYLSWDIEKMGPRSSATVYLKALDRTNGKEAARLTRKGFPSINSNTTTLVKNAICDYIDLLFHELMGYYNAKLTSACQQTPRPR